MGNCHSSEVLKNDTQIHLGTSGTGISYHDGQENVLVPIVEDFVKGLRQELGPQDRRPVWFDQTLTGGRRLAPGSRHRPMQKYLHDHALHGC